MKRSLILVLALVLAISCALLVACQNNIVDIKFKEETVPSEVTRGATIDYGKIKIIVTMEDGTTKELSLTGKDVSFTAIDVSTTGSKTLVVNYGGKSDQKVITVVEADVDDYTVTAFENTDGYKAYIEAKKEQTGPNANKEIEFFNREAPYTVGNTNGYVFIPKTSAILDADSDVVINTKVKTTYKLSLKNGATYTELNGTDLTNYVSKVENNIYYFTEEAVGKQFKLEVTLADTYATTLDASKKTVEQEFKVIEGYNVYNALGMAAMDNLNNKSWESIKQAKLDWDNGKSLAEYNNISKVIIHNNITITKNDLPTNYFWQEGEAALNTDSTSYQEALENTHKDFQHLLKGSLKETYLGETWEGGDGDRQHALYVNNGISLYGNYLKISYEAGYVEDSGSGNVTAPNGGIYVVYDHNKSGKKTGYPEAHWNLIGFRSEADEEIPPVSIENVYFVGQSKKTENTNVPCGIGMVLNGAPSLTVNNVIGNQWYFNVHVDRASASLTMDGSKFFDSFSQMVYGWYAKEINITNSTLKRAGGPLIILLSPNYVEGASGALEKDRTPIDFTIDSTNNLENWLTGSEVWFKINVKGQEKAIEKLFGMNALLNGAPVNGNYSKKVKGSDGKDMYMYNLLMVLIPFPDAEIFSQTEHLSGSVTIGDNVYSMTDPILNLRYTAQELADLVDELKTTFGDELNDGHKAALDQLKAGALGLKNNTDLLPLTVAPLYKSGNLYAYNDTEKLFVVPAVVKGLVQLSAGAQQAVGILQGKLNEVNAGIAQTEGAGGDATQLKGMAAVIQTTIAKWQAWITAVKPMTDLAEGVDITSDTADNQILAKWAQGWATNSENYVALWVNGGGLSSPPHLEYNYLMLVFGENNETVPVA